MQRAADHGAACELRGDAVHGIERGVDDTGGGVKLGLRLSIEHIAAAEHGYLHDEHVAQEHRHQRHQQHGDEDAVFKRAPYPVPHSAPPVMSRQRLSRPVCSALAHSRS